MPRSSWSDRQVEQIIGRFLQIGVLVVAAVVLVGGIMLLVQHGNAAAEFAAFRGEPEMLRTLGGIARGVALLDSRAIVQFGLALLIATPVGRVALMLGAFAMQRDRTYVVITAIVLALLAYSMFFAAA